MTKQRFPGVRAALTIVLQRVTLNVSRREVTEGADIYGGAESARGRGVEAQARRAG
jgi:hypothetical protein